MSANVLEPPTETAILGLDNVRLDLPIAGVGTRSLAAILDYALLAMLLLLWAAGGFATLGFLGIAQGWVVAIVLMGALIVQWSYFSVFEIATRGTTPGKNLLGLRVVSYHGGHAAAGAILMRNLVRAADLVVGLAIMAVDSRSRRLGDMAGNTLVIHRKPPGDDEDVRLGRLPPSWGAREVVVVESFLRRAPRMEPWRAQEQAGKLLRWIARQEAEFLAQAGESGNVAEMTDRTDRLALLRRLLQVPQGERQVSSSTEAS